MKKNLLPALIAISLIALVSIVVLSTSGAGSEFIEGFKEGYEEASQNHSDPDALAKSDREAIRR